jgi:hypothetical protein
LRGVFHFSRYGESGDSRQEKQGFFYLQNQKHNPFQCLITIFTDSGKTFSPIRKDMRVPIYYSPQQTVYFVFQAVIIIWYMEQAQKGRANRIYARM